MSDVNIDDPDKVTVVYRGEYAVDPGSKYTGRYALVQRSGSDKLSLLFESASKKHDDVCYLERLTNKPVFGDNSYAYHETYDDALGLVTNNKVIERQHLNKDFKLLCHATHIAHEKQRWIDGQSSCVVGRVLHWDAFDQTEFAIVTNSKKKGLHFIFKTIEPVYEIRLPYGASLERFYIEVDGQGESYGLESDETIFDFDHQYSLSYNDLVRQKALYEKNNPGKPPKEFPIFDYARKKGDQLNKVLRQRRSRQLEELKNEFIK